MKKLQVFEPYIIEGQCSFFNGSAPLVHPNFMDGRVPRTACSRFGLECAGFFRLLQFLWMRFNQSLKIKGPVRRYPAFHPGSSGFNLFDDVFLGSKIRTDTCTAKDGSEISTLSWPFSVGWKSFNSKTPSCNLACRVPSINSNKSQVPDSKKISKLYQTVAG